MATPKICGERKRERELTMEEDRVLTHSHCLHVEK